MEYNYLYRCEGCSVVKAFEADHGEVYAESCKICHCCIFHYKIEVRKWPYNKSDAIDIVCLGEANDHPRKSKDQEERKID